MQRKSNYLWPLMGAVSIGFLAGACARNVSSGDATTQGGAIDGPAIAQAGVPAPNFDAGANSSTGSAAGSIADLQNQSATYAAIARRVTPAVVNINSETVIPGRVMRDPLSEFFGNGGSVREPERRASSLGSGVIVDSRGIIVTNNHVVDNASTITVTLNDAGHRRYAAKLLGTDPLSDLAVLKITAGKTLPVVAFADSDKIQVGNIVLAIGSPFGLSSTVTQGIISARNRHDLGLSIVEDFLQTDASINPGNSGGALVDVQGRLVGINTAILSKSGGSQGIGLAIPSKLVRKISGQLTASGRVTRGYLGIEAEPMTEDIARQLKLPQAEGLIVTGVASNGPAASLPWQRRGGNVLLSINGKAIESPGQLRNIVTDADPGSKLNLGVWQNGQTKNFSVTVGRMPQVALSQG